MMILSLIFLAGLAGASVVDLESRQTAAQITTVDLAVNWGTPVRRASGILYGVPNTKNQIPSNFYTGMGVNYVSAGGAQFTGSSGWITGGYTGRFQNVLSNFQTARQFNAQFILKMSDLWGADGTQSSSAIYPGDNNNFAEYQRYLTQLVADLKANGTNLAGVPIAGPALANMPSSSNTWWTSFLSRVKADGTAPDVYTWHHEGSSTDVNNDLQTTQPAMVNLLNSFGLAIGEFIIDEYANPSEAKSRFSSMVDSQIRADYLSGLLWKSGSTYFPNGIWQVYQYYATSMTGHRVATTGSTDRLMDNFAVVGTNIVRILVGGRLVTGPIPSIVFFSFSHRIQSRHLLIDDQNLSAVGLATAGTINVRTRQFSFAGTQGQEGAPTDLGLVAHTYTGNVLTFPIFQTNTQTTWAFEFSF
ncbi:hypothetical protein C8J57DRAFT_1494817 [Mycena rebaudengoi]|nr:hypothetical protein C8J57DRAFT_1494817 [Mycena rebaudengoi]